MVSVACLPLLPPAARVRPLLYNHSSAGRYLSIGLPARGAILRSSSAS